MNHDLLVVGAGPAGLAAAATAANHGLRVMVVDEQPEPGGRLKAQFHQVPGQGWVRGDQAAARLAARARAAGVTLAAGTEVWCITPGWRVHVRGPGGAGTISADRLLLATGAIERPAVLPGWTLPGVLTVGAAQVFANVHRVRPGGRAILVGANVLALTIARALALAGVEVLGVCLPPPSLLAGQQAVPAAVIADLARLAHVAPSPLLRLGGALAGSRRRADWIARFYPQRGFSVWGIPLWLRQAAVRVEGRDQAEAVVLGRLSADGQLLPGERKLAADLICVSAGLCPLTELVQAAGAAQTTMPSLGGLVPLQDPHLRASVPGLYVAGSNTGIEAATVAEAQGDLAGLTVAVDAGRIPAAEASARLDQARAALGDIRARAQIQFDPHVAAARAELTRRWHDHLAGASLETSA